MKKFKLSFLGLAALLVLTAGPVKAAGSFEGEVDYTIHSKNGDIETAYFIKGHKMRSDTEMKGHKAGIIMDWTAKTMTMLMDEQKMYMKHDLPKPDKARAEAEGKFYKTGKTQVILGHKCAEWIYETDHNKTSMWLASGMGNFGGMQGGTGEGGQGKSSAWEEMAKSKGLFPLKVVTTKKDGSEEMNMEATKVEEKNLSSSLFEIPAGYRNMSDMMGGMGVPKF